MGAAENESGDSTGWKRLVSVAFLVQFFSMMGVSVVYAFLPLYVESLGIESEGRAAFWAGFLLFSQAIMVAVASPIWGSMADRYGAKLMLIRALLGCGTVWVLISFATSVYQLLPLFLLTGLFSGINTAMTNLVSGSVPRAKLGTAIGTVQTGVATGTAFGPLVGGVIADAYSFRIGIRVAAILVLTACALVIFFIHEVRRMDARGIVRPGLLEGIRQTSRSRPLMLLIGIIFLMQFGQQMVVRRFQHIDVAGTDAFEICHRHLALIGAALAEQNLPRLEQRGKGRAIGHVTPAPDAQVAGFDMLQPHDTFDPGRLGIGHPRL